MKRKYAFLFSLLFVVFVSLSIAGSHEFLEPKYNHSVSDFDGKIYINSLPECISLEKTINAEYLPQKDSKTPACSDQNDKSRIDTPRDFLLVRRGCCSHHDGVCGCDEKTGRLKCCDGTLSPTCRCSSN